MPYVITTKQPYLDAMWDPEDPLPPRESRYAVATWEKAREVSRARIGEWSGRMPRTWLEPLALYVGQAEKLPENGGTIGPLPDGTVIEVKRADWCDLIDGMVERGDDYGDIPEGGAQEILDAFNTREGDR